MLNLEQVGIEIGGNPLFTGASYQFRSGERVGLIGRNGAGKSTLLKIIAGERSPSEGKVNRSTGLNIAFFNQDLLSYQTERSVVEVAREAFTDLLALQAEIEELLAQVEAGAEDVALWDELATKQETFEARGGNQMEATVRSILHGLGFDNEAQESPYKTFSGGWRMRVLLAKMLLSEPDVLLLDEPTNHLDLPSIQWLENYLKNFRGCCIVVSHDRFFIDRVADVILEISLKRMNIYAGNYSFYLKEKAQRHELQQRAYENQQKYIAQQEEFINRFRAKATKARQAQSKLKQLEKLDRIEAPEEEKAELKMRFEMQAPSGKEVLALTHIDKSYGPLTILKDSEATIWRGDKIALIGANGTGKSTLLRILANTEPFGGERKEGYRVIPSFFAQHQLEALDLNADIVTEVSHAATGKTDTYIRNILGCFMFSGDDIYKPINVLSGGEKSRVALAKTLLSEANFLLLDEPTNHLDIPSIQILVEALTVYEGTYVVVSHDRSFLRQVANKIWYIEDQGIREYPGTYDEYAYSKEKTNSPVIEEKSHPKGIHSKPTNPPPTEAPIDYQEQKRRRNRIKKLKREIEQLETLIFTLEGKKEALESEMASPEIAADFSRLSEKQQELKQLGEEITQQTTTWENYSLELEELEN